MELYHLCDFAQVFVQKIESYKHLPKISHDEIEAIIVSYLQNYAEFYHIPLNLYRSDLHEKGTIMNGQLPPKSTKELGTFKKFATTFVTSDFLNLINNQYSINTELSKQILVESTDVEVILKKFLLEYKKYVPEIAYF